MKFIDTPIPGLIVIEPVRHGDRRGYFCETFRIDMFRARVGNIDFIQDNESYSTHGVLRGLHFQRGAAAQAKLVRVSRGTVVDVVVDLRDGSPSFGRHFAIELSADNGRQLFVPRGFAHGFVVTGPDAQFQYKVDNPYCPEAEATLSYDDPDLAISWPLPASELILSPKDLRGLPLSAITPYRP